MHSTTPVSGQIDAQDPLFTYLEDFVASASSLYTSSPNFQMSALDADRSIYLCREMSSGTAVVCKFFGGRSDLPRFECSKLLNHEFYCLNRVRVEGLDHAPLAVVRPLGKVEELGCLLAEEYVRGRSMDYYIQKAAHEGQGQRLVRKLNLLADFFAKLHQSTSCRAASGFSGVANSFRCLVRELAGVKVVGPAEVADFFDLCDRWEALDAMWSQRSCLVHGDATPTNFILHPQDGVTAIDLERMHSGDPMYDIGMFAAELKHHFALRILDAQASEPYIGQFYRRYCGAYAHSESLFRKMTFRGRFFMALGELRIARNPWLPMGHRRWLVQEARGCLLL